MIEIRSYTGGIAATNGYVVDVDSVSYVVDAPEGMAEWLEETGVKPEALLLTHAHFDHVLAAAQIAEKWGCAIYAHSDPSPELTLEAAWAAFGPSMQVKPYRVDHHLAEGDTVEFQGVSFEVLHVPGHSPDSLVFLQRAAGVLLDGDVLMQGGIGRDDLPGGDGVLLRSGIVEKLYTLEDAVRVFPGHGPPTTIGDERRSNPFVRG